MYSMCVKKKLGTCGSQDIQISLGSNYLSIWWWWHYHFISTLKIASHSHRDV